MDGITGGVDQAEDPATLPVEVVGPEFAHAGQHGVRIGTVVWKAVVGEDGGHRRFR